MKNWIFGYLTTVSANTAKLLGSLVGTLKYSEVKINHLQIDMDCIFKTNSRTSDIQMNDFLSLSNN